MSFTKNLKTYFLFHPVNTVLIGLNTVMLVITYAIGGFSVPNLLKLGAIFPPYIIDNNEYFRILMAMFLHGSLIHFLMNNFVLFQLGAYIERLIGSVNYFILYMVSGVVSSLIITYLGSTMSITIGASGAIYGVMAGLLVLTFIRTHWFDDRQIRSIRQLMLINVLLTFVIPNISILGHLGGLISGIAIIFLLTPKRPAYRKKLTQEIYINALND
ncbi:MAG TPA: rhomboid family intramembrane serine protease [Acholeplasma sp.]|nr:rhomboid family intramembrane serine protease [Acholeplasma sp.]